jgi:hypothetical protein
MSSPNSLIGALLLTVALTGCQQKTQEQAAVPVDLNQVKADLTTLSQARIYFAHQSVGRNMLKGIAMLSEETGVPLRIEEVKPGAPVDAGPGLFHANVGENGVADSKITAFVSGVAAVGSTAPYDVALLKFCYTDIGGDSKDKSPQQLFERYQKAMAGVQEQQPNLKLLHTTMPLRAEPQGMKTKVKRMLGMSAFTDSDNILRGEYNALVRTKESSYFDVARLEATRSDGSISAFSAQGRQVEMMAPEHTYDGGHLTDPAKRYFAAAFLRTLAEAVQAGTTGEPSGT